MLKVGLTGGLACGKTFISHELARLGCHIIQADLLGHEVLAPGGEGYEPVVQRFGPGILDDDRTINRARLAQIVFHDSHELAALNAIVHPAVRRREDQMIQEIAAAEPDAIVIVEAAILIEAGLHNRFDFLIVASCDEAHQLARALARQPETPEAEIRARIDRQMPLAEKRKLADFLIETSGSEEDTLQRTRHVFALLRRLSTQSRSQSLGQ